MQERSEGKFVRSSTGTRAGRLIDMFGGVSAMAHETGISAPVISRWDSTGPRGKNGNVPTQYNATIIAAATRLGLDLKAVGECLNPHTCPMCGHDLEPGQAA